MSSTKSSSSSSSSASASSAGGDPSALSPALKYFLTLLRGELVLIEQCDGTIHEGLFHTLETNETSASGTAATGMALVLRMAQKQSNQHSSKKAELPTFETERNATNPFIGVLKIPLTNIVQLFASDLSLAQWTMAYADWMSKNGSNKSASHHQRTGGAGQAFATDSQISGASDRERELVRWAGDDDGTNDVGGLETSASLGEFNQFETFERMTGKTSTFKFDDYSTPLDRSSAFYKSNEARAAALASQILSSEAGSIHQKLEREGDECSTLRDRDADEGDLFSDVRREPTTGTAASAVSSTASTGKYKPGAFAKAKKEKEAALAAAAAAASTTSPSAAKTPGVTSPTKEAVASNAAVKSPPPSATKASEPTTAAAAAGNSSSPKPVEISLAAQQKVAEAASSTPAKDSTTEAAAATPATSATEASVTEAKDTKADATATDGAKSTSEQPAKPKSTLNPKAPSFKLSASAREFTPSFAATPAATAAAPAAPLLNTVAPVHGVGQQPFMASPPVGQMFMPNVPLMPGVGMAPPFPPQMNIPQMMNLNLGGNVGLGGVRGVPPSMLGQAPGGGFFLPPQQQQQAQAAAAAQQQAAFLMQQMMFNPQFAAAAAHNMRQQQQQPTPNQFAQLFQQQQFQQQLAQAQIQQQFQQQQQQQQQQAVQAQQIQRQTSGNASTTTPVAGSPQAAQQQQQQQQFRPQQF